MKANPIKITFFTYLCIMSINVFGDDSKNPTLAIKPFVCNNLSSRPWGGGGLERGFEIFNAETNETVCTSAMANRTCPNQRVEKDCKCPPQEWKDNNCNEKWNEYKKLYEESRMKQSN